MEAVSNPWFWLVGTLIAALVGAAVRVYINERNSDEQEVVTNDGRWEAMLRTQREHFEALIGPMQAEIRSLREEVEALKASAKRDERITKIALDFIRTLLAWIDRNFPGSTPPEVPRNSAKTSNRTVSI